MMMITINIAMWFDDGDYDDPTSQPSAFPLVSSCWPGRQKYIIGSSAEAKPLHHTQRTRSFDDHPLNFNLSKLYIFLPKKYYVLKNRITINSTYSHSKLLNNVI